MTEHEITDNLQAKSAKQDSVTSNSNMEGLNITDADTLKLVGMLRLIVKEEVGHANEQRNNEMKELLMEFGIGAVVATASYILGKALFGGDSR